MTTLMYGKPLIEQLDRETIEFVREHNLTWMYCTIFLCNESAASRAYIRLKEKKAESLWLRIELIHDAQISLANLLEQIAIRNDDPQCVGIIVQLPLPLHLQDEYGTIMKAISPYKDLDWLGWTKFGETVVWAWTFLPATPKATVRMIEHYYPTPLAWATVVVIGQSNLVGKPVATRLIGQQCTVICVNSLTDRERVQEQVRQADIVVSATGVQNLLWKHTDPDQKLLNKTYLFDAWWWKTDGVVHGDMERNYFADYVWWITPVPWGIGPVTVSCIFHNLRDIFG